MTALVNRHVEMLNATQPFDASFSEIYFESSSSTIRLATRAAETLASKVREPGIRLVVLTGDAGHGKTYMCADLAMQVFGWSLTEARTMLNDRGSGNQALGQLSDGRDLFVVKDLSELPTSTITSVISDALAAPARVTVICANEGRFRSAIRTDPQLVQLLALLDDSIRMGRTTGTGVPAVVLNLNHQSVVAQRADRPSLLEQVLHEWVMDEEAWQSCTGCSMQPICPIFHNRAQLADGSDDGASVRQVITELLRVVERTGYVVTIRELLILVSHLITGGLRCSDVEAKSGGAAGWQWPHLYHQVCFGTQVPPEVGEGLRAFQGLAILDPGTRALRSVDDRLDLPLDPGPFDPPFPETLLSAPTTSSQANQQATDHASLWRELRRQDLFAAHTLRSPATTYERLGLRHADEFDTVLAGEQQTSIRKKLMAGLAAVQGLGASSKMELQLVDPAFTTSSASRRSGRGAGAAVIAGKISANKVVVSSQSGAWQSRAAGEPPEAVEQIDWSDRRVIVSLGGASFEERSTLELDLAGFEFLLSFGEGLRAWKFYEADVRRVLRRLAAVAEGLQSDDDVVDLVSPRGRYRLEVEDGVLRGGE